MKPQNVFVGGEGLYKLGDFGCAVRVTRRRDGTYEPVGKTPGTPAFTAPECCDGEPCDGFKADVWAAGMTIHALATGKYFYQADSAWETYQKILETRVDMSEIEATEDELFIDFLATDIAEVSQEAIDGETSAQTPVVSHRSTALRVAHACDARARVPTASARRSTRTQSPPERFRSWREEIDEPKNKIHRARASVGA